MKKIMILSFAILNAFAANAEVKPDNAVIPSECGRNYLELPGGPEYPSQVCVYSVEGTDKKLIGLDSYDAAGELTTKYYLIISDNYVGKSLIRKIWGVPAQVVEEDGYAIYKGELNEIAVEFTRIYNSLSGPMFEVELEPVVVTLDL